MKIAPAVLAVGAAACLGPVATANAQAPVSGDFGGGALGATTSRAAANTMTLGIRVQDARVHLDIALLGRCSAAFARRTATLAPDGTFAVRTRGSALIAGGFRQTFRLTMSGRLTPEGGEGTASARLTGRERGGRLRRCRTRTVHWVVRPSLGAGAGPQVAAPAGATLFGTSAQRDRQIALPVIFRVSQTGRRVAAGLFGFRARCRRRAVLFNTNLGINVTKPAPIAADGSFRSVERYRFRYKDAVEHTTIVFSGRFTAGGALGGLSLTSRFTNRRTGRFMDRCASGTHTWTART